VRSGPEPIRDILSRSLEGLGLLPRAKRYQVFSMWSSIIGKAAAHAQPRYLDGDVLYVATSTSAWAQELTLMKRKILLMIEKTLGGKYIRDILFGEHLWQLYSSSKETMDATARSTRKTGSPASKESLKGTPLGEREGGQIGGYLESLAMDIGDKSLSERFRRFALVMEGRKAQLVRRGYSICPKCGYVYPASNRHCPACRDREEFRAKLRAISILEKHPEMSDLAASVAADISQRVVCEMARQELEDRWERNIRHNIVACRRNPSLREELVISAKNLLSSRKKTRVTELDWETLEKILGKRLCHEMREVLRR